MAPRASALERRTELRARILDAFEERARLLGPRAVVMAELARDLGISTRTLYKIFASKSEVVQALMESWAERMEAESTYLLESELSARQRLLETSVRWVENENRFSKAFWKELRRDFPEAAAVLHRQLMRNLGRAREVVEPAMRHGVNRPLAMALLAHGLRDAADPDFCNHAGVSREEAVAEVVELWCRGAFGPKGIA